jgi:ferritin
MSRFTEALNEQIAYEFGASQQYVAIAVHYDAQTLPQLAAHFYRQAVEERNHAMMMVQYLLDADEDVLVPAVEAPQVSFPDVVAPVQLALDQEKRVTGQIQQLAITAREEVDLVAEQFMHWFLQEQREEVSSMSALLDVVTRSKDDVMDVEDYLARESGGENPLEAGAPPAAGGAL